MVCHIRASYVCGSSPRVWGIRPRHAEPIVYGRFIPTRVGDTSTRTTPWWKAAVHPHACGGYLKVKIYLLMIFGSSPRVWGILSSSKLLFLLDWFIPTRVGNTRCAGAVRQGSPVHPHACGEYGGEVSGEAFGVGSSPRVWGIHRQGHQRAAAARFIPTRVGNTFANYLF